MQHRPHYFRSPGEPVNAALPAHQVARYGEQWILAGDSECNSDATLANHKVSIRLLIWFLKEKDMPCFDTQTLREFFSYCRHGHNDPLGRWGGKGIHCKRPLTSGSLATYHRHLTAFCNWLVSEDVLDASPMDRIRPPEDNPDDIEPYSAVEINALLEGVKEWPRHRRRDTAIILLLLDTGIRASELTGLTSRTIEYHPNRVRVLGKGHKTRCVPFQSSTRRAMWNYALEAGERYGPDALDEQFFRSDAGMFTASGVLHMIYRVARVAGVSGATVHRFRHTAAISFLRAGGNVYELAAMLGHTSLKMSQHYARIADTDVEISHRKHSPVEFLLGRN